MVSGHTMEKLNNQILGCHLFCQVHHNAFKHPVILNLVFLIKCEKFGLIENIIKLPIFKKWSEFLICAWVGSFGKLVSGHPKPVNQEIAALVNNCLLSTVILFLNSALFLLVHSQIDLKCIWCRWSTIYKILFVISYLFHLLVKI